MNRRTTVLIMAVALVSAGCWLQPGNDAERSGFAPLESNITTANVDQLHFDWSKQFAAPAAAPAVAIDALYVNAGSSPNAGTLYRLAPTDGATQWSKELFAAGTPFYTPQQPTVTGDVVYVAETGFSILPSSIMRFNAVAGTPLPLIAAGGHDLTQRGSLLVSTLATGNSSMIAVSKVFVTDTQGSGSWNTIITVGSLGSVPTPTSAAATTSRFFIGNGAEILAYPLTKPASCPLVSNVEVCPADWKHATPTKVDFHPVLTTDQQTVIAPTQDSILALATADGAERWTGILASKPSAAPAIANGLVYVPTSSGKLAVFNANGCGSPTCSPLWTADAGSLITQPPSVTSGGLVYTGSDDGTVHAFPAAGCGAATCTSLWSVATGSKITGGPVNALGRIFVATADGRIISYTR